MNYDGVKRLVAQKSGMNLAQNRTLVETAISGALEETGVHMTIAKAIKKQTMTIAASTNNITWSKEYSRFVSIVYVYTSGDSTYRRPLRSIAPTEYELLNAGIQS